MQQFACFLLGVSCRIFPNVNAEKIDECPELFDRLVKRDRICQLLLFEYGAQRRIVELVKCRPALLDLLGKMALRVHQHIVKHLTMERMLLKKLQPDGEVLVDGQRSKIDPFLQIIHHILKQHGDTGKIQRILVRIVMIQQTL